MLVEKVASNVIKIHLNIKDLCLLGISANQLNCRNVLSKNLIRALLRIVKSQNFNVDHKTKMLVQLHLMKEDGMIIYFTHVHIAAQKHKTKLLSDKAYIYEFENADDLLNAFNAVDFTAVNLKGDLFLLNRRYKLVLHALNTSDFNLLVALNEYGKRQNSSRYIAAHLKESGKILFENKNLRELAKLFK